MKEKWRGRLVGSVMLAMNAVAVAALELPLAAGVAVVAGAALIVNSAWNYFERGLHGVEVECRDGNIVFKGYGKVRLRGKDADKFASLFQKFRCSTGIIEKINAGFKAFFKSESKPNKTRKNRRSRSKATQ